MCIAQLGGLWCVAATATVTTTTTTTASTVIPSKVANCRRAQVEPVVERKANSESGPYSTLGETVRADCNSDLQYALAG